MAYGLGGVFSQIYVTLEGRLNITMLLWKVGLILDTIHYKKESHFFTVIVNYPKRNIFVNNYRYASQILPVQRTVQLQSYRPTNHCTCIKSIVH